MAATRIGLLLIGMLGGCAFGSPRSVDPLMETLNNQEACFRAVEMDTQAVEIKDATASIPNLVENTLHRLPARIKLVVQQAASNILPYARRHSKGELATSDFLATVRTAAYVEFSERLDYDIPECGSAVFEVLPGMIFRNGELENPPLKEQFAAIGLADRYQIARALVLMLVLEATREPWQPIWFAGYPQENRN